MATCLRARVKAFREPAVNRSEQFARLLRLPLVTPEPRYAHCGAEFPALCLLLTCDCERTLKIGFSRSGALEYAPDALLRVSPCIFPFIQRVFADGGYQR